MSGRKAWGGTGPALTQVTVLAPAETSGAPTRGQNPCFRAFSSAPSSLRSHAAQSSMPVASLPLELWERIAQRPSIACRLALLLRGFDVRRIATVALQRSWLRGYLSLKRGQLKLRLPRWELIRAHEDGLVFDNQLQPVFFSPSRRSVHYRYDLIHRALQSTGADRQPGDISDDSRSQILLFSEPLPVAKAAWTVEITLGDLAQYRNAFMLGVFAAVPEGLRYLAGLPLGGDLQHSDEVDFESVITTLDHLQENEQGEWLVAPANVVHSAYDDYVLSNVAIKPKRVGWWVTSV